MKRIYAFIIINLFLISFSACASSESSGDLASASSNKADVEAKLKQAEALYKERDDLDKLRKAVNTLAQARNPEKRNYEVEWKYAEYNFFLGNRTDDKKESEKAFKEGEQAGKIARNMQPDKPDGHFWYAVNLSEQAQRSPLTVGITSVDTIREEMKKVIEIKPDYQGATPFDVLGRIELVTMMTGGKPEKAIEYFKKGLELENNNSYLHLHLAEAYLAVGREADAKKELEYVLQMKPDPKYIPEFKEAVEEAKRLLRTRF